MNLNTTVSLSKTLFGEKQVVEKQEIQDAVKDLIHLSIFGPI